jgi:hypothetical protein
LARFTNHWLGRPKQVVIVEKAAVVVHEEAILENGCSRDRAIQKQNLAVSSDHFGHCPPPDQVLRAEILNM